MHPGSTLLMPSATAPPPASFPSPVLREALLAQGVKL
jgi:hypothetical protein